MQYEWGPWIEHDGKGFPEWLRGLVIEVDAETHLGNRVSEIGITRTRTAVEHWDWANFGKPSRFGWAWARVIRYRVRRPRVVEWLDQVTGDLPVEVHA